MRTAVRKKKSPLLPVLACAVIILVLLVILTLWKMPSEPDLSRSAEMSCLVCIDPGHGGDDQGASWDDRLEKDDNLALALALRDRLEARGVGVVMTRSEDITLSLEERVAIAEDNRVDYFISLHRNLFEGEASGVEIWVAQHCSDAAQDLAERVDAALVSVGVQRDRGVRRGSQDGKGDYFVLSHTSMPAILVEMGFMQDAQDNRLLDKYLNEYAAAMADAILAAWEETSA